MTAEEVWREALRAFRSPDWEASSAAVIRTAMEAYAAEKVAEALAACPAATSMHGCPSYRPEPRP